MPSYTVFQLYFGQIALSWNETVNLLFFLIIILALVELVLNFIADSGLLDKNYELLELRLPKDLDKDIDEEGLYKVICKLIAVNRLNRISLEAVKDAYGVRFLAYLSESNVEGFKSIVRSHFPGSTFSNTKDYLPINASEYKVLSFSYLDSSNEDADRFRVILELLSRDKSDLASYQVVIKPHHKGVIYLILKSVRLIINILKGFLGKQSSPPKQETNLGDRPFCYVSIRILVSQDDNGLSSALGHLSKDKLASALPRGYLFKEYKRRLPRLSPLCKLDVASLPSLYSFKTLVTGLSSINSKQEYKALPLDIELSNRPDSDITLGINKYEDAEYEIRLSDEERQRHLFIVGSTGSGKSTMLGNLIEQDIKNGKGLALIDPHGDLAEEVIKKIPRSRLKDVIYFDPADISHPIGLNILEIDKTLSGDGLMLAQDFVTESVVSILRKLFSDNDSGGHRLEHILRNAVQTALTVEDTNLFTVYRLLTDSAYRFSVVAELKDKTLKSFWTNEYMKAGDMQRVKLSIGVTSKLGRFLRSTATRRILGQAHSTIDFDEIINSGKILICNFSKGKIGEDTSTLLGSSVLTQLQLSAYKRQHMSQADRKPFYLYIDEFQNFSSSAFSQMLSEARKLLSTMLSNIGTLICFRCSSPIDENLLLSLFKPNLHEGDLLKLPSFTFYARDNAIKSYEPFSGETILDKCEMDNSQKVILFSRNKYGFKS